MDEYPQEVQEFHQAVLRLTGVQSIDTSIKCLGGLKEEWLSLSDFAFLPHAAYRRTKGAVGNETLIQPEFEISMDKEGLRALEFLAWWVRDLARAGELIQLRPVGLPPTMGDQVQLGSCLRFHIDIFRMEETEDIAPHLAKMASLAQSLDQTIDLYDDGLVERGAQPLSRADSE